MMEAVKRQFEIAANTFHMTSMRPMPRPEPFTLSQETPPDQLEAPHNGDKSGGYYGTAFKGERGVTQGDPPSPTIFNVVVDAVVRH